ncbi:MAG: alpha/beta hydrolase [Myxococcales bacterium]|nr:alpha/beta hydrolase [Myxococcales bacterium]MDD9972145.1 alpha/beta hydrolase [Myxococcales bacterium]
MKKQQGQTGVATMVGLLVVSIAIGAAPTAVTHLRAAGVLMQIMNAPRPSWLAALEFPIVETREQLRLPGGMVSARRFRPQQLKNAPPLVLLHGVHPEGIDEARQVAFARSMARAGLDVLTPSLPELARFQVTATTLPRIVHSAQHHAKRTGRETAGVIGISFAGGLALVAASQAHPPWASFIVTVGSHHNLMRLASYYAGNPIEGPDGKHHSHTAHPYGSRVLIHAHAEHFFPPEDVAEARRLLERWMASDGQGARAGIGRLRSNDSRAVMAQILDSEVRAPLGDQIMTAVEGRREALLAASPAGKLAAVKVPVFAVHGAGDPIIPSTETRWLAHELPDKHLASAVITPLLRHAEMPEEAESGAYLELVGFMGAILSSARTR